MRGAPAARSKGAIMRLLERMALLIKADAHGLVESLEDRTLLLKQYVREAELELARKRARRDALRDDEKRLAEAHARCEEQVRALDDDIALALGGGRDDLARFAIRRLIPLRAEAMVLAAQMGQRRDDARVLDERITVQQTQFDALRTRVNAELARCAEFRPEAPTWTDAAAVTEEAVDLELMRRRQGVSS
jgi:phage shock protein A